MSKDNKASATKKSQTQPEQQQADQIAFTTTNYILMGIGILLLVAGYILLSGGGSDDPNVFNDAMFDTRRLVVAPLTIIAGLIVEICAIMYRGKKKGQTDNE